jgi:predicted hotdog family 3-hydroxylacyl-ACP dehydratase
MKASQFSIDEILPHGPEATLIDRLVETSAEQSVATVKICESTPFLVNGFVPAYIGIEYMAQTIAARVGFDARVGGRPPPIGFLLGTRAYQTYISAFALGCEVVVRVKPLLVDGGFGSFECWIEINEPVATAVLTMFQPGPEMLQEIAQGGS